MRIEAFSPRTGNKIANDITGINFGNIRQGDHSVIPVVIRPIKTVEDTFDELSLFLQNDGGYNLSEFGYYVTGTFITGVQSYVTGISTSAVISDHFILNPQATGTGGVNLTLDSEGNAEYVWLDVQVGATETGSTSNINYRFIFEYS